MASKKAPLRPRDKLVLDEYFRNGFSMAAAMRKAGYPANSANSAATAFLRRPAIADEVARRKDALAKAQEASFEKQIASESEILAVLSKNLRAGEILSRYKRVDEDGSLYWDFTDATPEDLAVISELSVETYVEGKGQDAQTIKRFKVKHADVTTAAQLLMRQKGMLKDKVDIGAAESLVEILQQRGRQASPEKTDA